MGIDSYHGRRYGVALDGKFADIGARFTGKRVRSNGYRAGADFAKDDGLLRLNRQYASGRLELQLQRVDQDRLALGALTRAQVHDNPRRSGSKLNIHSRTDNGRIGWQQDVGLAHLEVDVYHTDFSSKAPSDSPTFGHALTLIDRKQTAFAPRVLLDFDVTRVLLGADVNHEDFRFANASTTFGDSGNEQQLRSAAAYAVLYQPVRADVDLELGLRRTNARNNATGFAGSDAIAHKFKEHDTAWETGVQWRATAALAVSARIATSFRIPKVDEQLSVFTGLKPLETQTGRSAEFTMNYQRETVAAMLNLYHIRLRHEIDFDPRADFFGDNINLRPTQRMGAIASATWNIASSLSAGINAHVVHAALSGGNTVPFVPKRSALVWVNWQPAHWLEARVESAYTGPRYAIGDYANASGEQGGFTVVNIGLRGRWRDATLTARADNVFAHRYTELVSYVGFLNALSYQPGTGRRYSVTFQYALP